MVDDKIDDDIKMHLCCGPFRRPCGCAGAIQTASPNAACPGLLRKPLDASIGQLLTPYCPSGRQGNRQTNNNQQMTLKGGQIDGHNNAPVRYRAHCPIEEV